MEYSNTDFGEYTNTNISTSGILYEELPKLFPEIPNLKDELKTRLD